MFRYSFLAALFCIFLSSCSTSVSPQYTIQAELKNWTAGSAALNAMFYADKEGVIASGQLTNTGIFEVNLSTSITNDLLEPLAACDALTMTNGALRSNQFSAFSVSVDGEDAAGLVALASSEAVMQNGLSQVGDYYVQYIYANSASSISGDCPLGGVPGVFRYDLQLTQGWNTALFSLVDKSGIFQTVELSSKAVPSDAAWFFAE